MDGDGRGGEGGGIFGVFGGGGAGGGEGGGGGGGGAAATTSEVRRPRKIKRLLGKWIPIPAPAAQKIVHAHVHVGPLVRRRPPF